MANEHPLWIFPFYITVHQARLERPWQTETRLTSKLATHNTSESDVALPVIRYGFGEVSAEVDLTGVPVPFAVASDNNFIATLAIGELTEVAGILDHALEPHILFAKLFLSSPPVRAALFR